ncbi:MAG: L-2-amino-thiazoline-4-carboxylic acid hydrolase [Deltaproteobacteria bacterium]|nr:L-2-amino-thiazoline-4-carboxylic acid hydrolase [Deltaproteobacteria bacterium]
MPLDPFHPTPLRRARLLSTFLEEIRRKAGLVAATRAIAALSAPATFRRQAALAGVGASPILYAAVGAVACYHALVRSIGPHRALGTLRAAIVAAARHLALPPLRAADDDPLEALAEAIEATLSTGQELGIYDVRWLEGAPGTVQLEILRCRIHEICHAAGAPEVTTCFCDAESPLLTRGDPQLVLVRDMTIARGAPLCRFTFHVVGDLTARRARTAAAASPTGG